MNPERIPQVPAKPEELKFKVLRPGDERTTLNFKGDPFKTVLGEKEWAIILDEGTGISLEDYQDYFFIDGIHVEENLRRQGIATKLFEEARNLAIEEGKKGLLSLKSKRQPITEHMWMKFKQEGKTGEIEINGDKYDVLNLF